MLAAVCTGFGRPLALEEVVLDPPGPGEIEVDVAACAVCHSDILYADGAWGGTLPAVYGHEAAGVVRAVGSGVAEVRPGDHVVVTLIRSCGHCPSCSQGALVTCETRFPLDERSPLRRPGGEPLVQGLRTAAFAERVVVDQSQVVAIPSSLPLEAASLLACGVITGFGAVANTAAVRPGSSVVVIGAGGVGLNAIQGAAIAGAAKVIVLDMVPGKLEAARRFGATHAILASDGAVAEEVRSLTGGRGADYVLVAVGARAGLRAGVRPRGTGRGRSCSSACRRTGCGWISTSAPWPAPTSGSWARRWAERRSGGTFRAWWRSTSRGGSSWTS